MSEITAGKPVQLQAATQGRHRLEEQLAEAQGRISELRDQLERAHAAAAEERQRAQQEVSAVHSDLNAIVEERYQLQARTPSGAAVPCRSLLRVRSRLRCRVRDVTAI